MNTSWLAGAIALGFACVTPAGAADEVAAPAPAASGTVVKRSATEVRVPSARETENAVKRGAAKAAAAADRAEASIKRQVQRAKNAAAKGEVTTTTVQTGDPSAPVVIRNETSRR